jgi:hypothetical protein
VLTPPPYASRRASGISLQRSTFRRTCGSATDVMCLQVYFISCAPLRGWYSFHNNSGILRVGYIILLSKKFIASFTSIYLSRTACQSGWILIRRRGKKVCQPRTCHWQAPTIVLPYRLYSFSQSYWLPPSNKYLILSRSVTPRLVGTPET